MSSNKYDRVAEFRRQQGMNQQDLAQAADVATSTINRVESGKNVDGISGTIVKKIADALYVHPLQLSSDVPHERIELAISCELERYEDLLDAGVTDPQEQKRIERKLRRLEMQLASIERERDYLLRSTTKHEDHQPSETQSQQTEREVPKPKQPQRKTEQPKTSTKKPAVKAQKPSDNTADKKLETPSKKVKLADPRDVLKTTEFNEFLATLPRKIDGDEAAKTVIAELMQYINNHQITADDDDLMLVGLIEGYLNRRVTRDQRGTARKYFMGLLSSDHETTEQE